MQEAPGSVPIKQGWQYIVLILVLKRWRWEGQKFRVILSYILSLKPFWVI